MRRAAAPLLLAAILSSPLCADDYGEPTYYVTSPTISTSKGWFWEDVNQTRKTKIPPSQRLVNPKEDRREAKEILTGIENQMKMQTEIMAKMLEILEYNFPRRTPKYVINKKTGEKCLANSSADCFVVPVTPEAQQIPVLKKFLRDPNIQTASEWLRWFATYQNHINDFGMANAFAYKQYGREVYPTNTAVAAATPKGGGENARRNVKELTVAKMGDRLAVYVFYGRSKAFESMIDPAYIFGVRKGAFRNFPNFKIVFDDKSYYSDLYRKFVQKASPREIEVAKGTKIVRSKKLFEKYGIDHTPAVVAVLLDEKGKPVGWQKVAFSNSYDDMVAGIYDFLVFHRVVDPSNISDETALEAVKLTRGEGYAPKGADIRPRINDEDAYELKFDEKQSEGEKR